MELGEEIKKLILAGIGAAAAGREKYSAIVDELVKKGEITVEHGRALNEELKHNIKETVKDSLHIEALTPDTLSSMSEEELEALEEQISEVRKKRRPDIDCSDIEDRYPDEEPVLVKEEPDTEDME